MNLSARAIASSVGRLLLSAVLTLFVISVVTFAAMNYKSGEGIARSALGNEVTQKQLQAFVKDNDLDRPITRRYLTWLGGAIHGDFGRSPLSQRPVSETVLPRLGRTVSLAVLALLLAAPLAIVMGVAVARRPSGWLDRTSLVGSVLVAAIPEFVLGMVLLVVLAVQLGWFPVNASAAFEFGTFADQAKAYAMPTIVLMLSLAPYTLRLTRAATRDVLRSPYVQAATLRGLPNRTVVWDHAVRNAAAPIIAVLSLNLVSLLGGVIVVENVFGFPGVGQSLVEAIGSGDALTVQAIAVLLGGMFIVIGVVADLATLYFTPRMRAATR